MPAEDPVSHRFVLEVIDPETECVALEAKLQVADVSEVLDLLDPDAAEVVADGAGCDLEPGAVSKLKVHFDLAFRAWRVRRTASPRLPP